MTAGRSSQRDEPAIRAASPDDAVAIASVHVGSFLATYPWLPKTRRAAETGLPAWTAVWTARLAEPEAGRLTFVAADGSRVWGFVHLGPSPDPDHDPRAVGQVLSIHVDPERTGKGVGGRLMRQALASFRDAGYRAATLWVVADHARARAFYERLGWRPDGARRREVLAVDGDGDEVEVVRYRMDLGRDQERRP